MSEVIENQIVKMSFDNKDFEKNIDTSIKSLETLKSNMEFSDESKNFKSLEKSVNSLNFDGANKAIDNINEHFTILGRTAYKVADSIADYFSSKLIGAFNKIKSVSTDLIDVKSGYAKYDEYTTSVKTIMSSLGDEDKAYFASKGISEIEGVEKALADLMLYTDETSYSFNTMADTIGKFMGAGIPLESAIQDMQGIANWAALAGQNATIASQSMYQMSQALGRGYVQYSDWKEMANSKNMGTVEAKKVFVEAGLQTGTIHNEDIEKARAAVKELKGDNYKESDLYNWFFESEQLNKQQWLNTETLEQGLHTMSLFSNAAIDLVNNAEALETTSTQLVRYFDKYKKAVAGGADETEAFNELLTNLKIDKTASDYKDVVEQLHLMASAEYDVGFRAYKVANQAVTFGEAIQATADAVGTKFVGIFDHIIGNYEEVSEIWTDLSNVLWDIFAGPLDSILLSTEDWKYEISEADGSLTNYQYLWKGIYGTLKGISSVFSSIKESILGSDFNIGIVVVNALNKISEKLNKISEKINEFVDTKTFKNILSTISNIRKAITSLLSIIKMLSSTILSATFNAIKASGIIETITDLINKFTGYIAKCIDNFKGSEGFNSLLNLMVNLLSLAGKVLKALSIPLKAIASFIGKVVLPLLEEVIIRIDKVVSFIINKFSFALKSGSNAVDVITSLISSSTGIIVKALELLGNALGIDLTKAIKLVEKASEKLIKWIEKVGERSKGFIKNISERIFGIIPDEFSKMIDKFTNGDAGERIEAVLEFLGKCMLNGVLTIIEAVETLTGIDLSLFKSLIIDFVEGLIEKLNGTSPEFKNVWDVITYIFRGLIQFLKDLSGLILDILGQLTGIEDFGPENFFDLLYNTIEKLIGFGSWLLEKGKDVLVAIGPLLQVIGELLLSGFKELGKALSYIVGKDNSEEAEEAFKRVKKVIIAVISVMLVMEAYNIFKTISWFVSSLSGVAESLGRVSIKAILTRVVGIILGIALVILSISKLASMDVKSVALGLLAMFVIVKLLMWVIKKIVDVIYEYSMVLKKSPLLKDEKVILSVFGSITKIITKISLSLLIISAAIYIMSKAFQGDDSNAMLMALITVSVMMVGLTVCVRAIVASANGLKKNTTALENVHKILSKLVVALTKILIDIALLTAFLKFQFKDSSGIISVISSMAMIALTFAGMSVMINLLNKTSKSIKVKKLDTVVKTLNSIAKAFIKISIGMAILIASIKLSMGGDNGVNSIKSLGLGLAAWIGILSIIVIAISVISLIANKKFIKKLNKTVKSISEITGYLVSISFEFLLLTVIMTGMSEMIKIFTSSVMSIDLIPLLISVAIISGIIIGMDLLSKIIKSAKMNLKIIKKLGELAICMIEVAASGIILGIAISILSTIFSENSNWWVGVLGLVGMIAILVGLAELLANAPKVKKKIDLLTVCILRICTSLLIMAAALKVLGGMETSELLKGGVALLGLIAIIAALAFIATIAGPVTIALDAMSKAILRTAIGIAIFAATMLVLAALSTIFDDIIEGLRSLEEYIPEFVEVLVDLLIVLIESLATSIGNNAADIASAILKLAGALLELIFEALVQLGQSLRDFFKSIGMDCINGLWDGIVTVFKVLLNMLKFWFIDLPLAVCEVLGIHSPSTVFAEIGGYIIEGLWNGIKTAADFVWGLIKDIFHALIEIITLPFKIMMNVGSDIINDIWNGMKLVWNGFVNFIKSIPETIIKFFKDPLGTIKEIGGNLLRGLWNGINDVKDWIVNKVKGVGKEIINCFKDVFGIHSPSTVLKAIGGFLMDGLDIGLTDGLGSVLGDVTGIGNSITDTFTNSINLDNIIPDMDSLTSSVNIDTSSIGNFDANSLGLSDVYNLDLAGSYAGSGISIPTNYEPTITDGQLSQLSSSYDDSNQSVVDAIAELKNQMAEMTEQIKSYQMVLDTGVLVGELAAPMDKALGTKNRLAGRGV